MCVNIPKLLQHDPKKKCNKKKVTTFVINTKKTFFSKRAHKCIKKRYEKKMTSITGIIFIHSQFFYLFTRECSSPLLVQESRTKTAWSRPLCRVLPRSRFLYVVRRLPRDSRTTRMIQSNHLVESVKKNSKEEEHFVLLL